MAAVKVNKEQLIEAVKNFPCLYDTSRKEYKDDLLRENAWSAICAELFGRTYNDKDLLVNDITLLKKTFKSLRDRYMKVKREYKPSGSAGGISIEPSWPYYKHLEFLSPYIRHRDTQGNFHAVNEESQRDSFEIVSSETMEETDLSDSVSNVAKTIEENREHSLDSTISSPCTPVSEQQQKTSIHEKIPSLCGSKSIKRPKKDTDSSEFLMKVLQNTDEFLSSASQREQPDEDDLFGQSVGKQLKKLTPYQRSLAKLKIQLVLHEVAWQQEPVTDVNP